MSDLTPSKIEVDYVVALEQNNREIAGVFALPLWIYPARISNEDPCGVLLDHGVWEHLCLPVESLHEGGGW